MPNILACYSKPERAYWSLTPQLDTVIIEESSMKVLSLRSNPWRLYRTKHEMGPMVTQDFTAPKLPILAWRYLQLLKMRGFFKPLLTWVMVDTSAATGLLHYSTLNASTALLMAAALLYNTDWCLSVAFVWFSYFLYNLDIDAYKSSGFL